MIVVTVKRKAGHPWSGMQRPNFDLMEIFSDNQSELTKKLSEAKEKFWEIWVGGGELVIEDGCSSELNFHATHGAILYKPSNIMQSWEDNPDNPHPGGS